MGPWSLAGGVVLAVVSLLGAGCAGGGASSKAAAHPLVGAPAPAVDLAAVGTTGRATTAQPGRVVILDFWATHCGPCVKAFPRLQALVDQHAGKVAVVGISEDDEVDVVEPFLKRTGVRFAIGWDDGKALAERYKVDSMPTTFVLDRQGVVRFVHRGYHEDEVASIDEEVRRLLAE